MIVHNPNQPFVATTNKASKFVGFGHTEATSDAYAGTKTSGNRSCPVSGAKPPVGMEPNGKTGTGVCPFVGMPKPEASQQAAKDALPR